MVTTAVSVVIPTRDTRDLTLMCLASVARAAGGSARVEVIVVDDGSGDGTSDAITQAFPTVRLVRHDRPQGFSAAANAGLRDARGTMLLLLNSDAEIATDGLGALEQAFERDERLGVAGAQLWYPDGRPQWSGGAAPGLVWLFLQATGAHVWLARVPGYRTVRPLAATAGREVDWVTGAAIAFRRAVWDSLQSFNESFHVYAQDLDFCLRARAAGWRVAIVPACRVVHHQGATIDHLSGAAAGQNPEAMWRDLTHWADLTRGAGFAHRAAGALRRGATLRILGRRLVTPFVPGSRRPAWRRQTDVIRQALDAMRRTTAGDLR